MNTITDKTYKALSILSSASWDRPMSAKEFAKRLWGDDQDKECLFNAHTNSGNGACAGKKAWLCAGSLLGRLRKKGLVSQLSSVIWSGYVLTDKGKQAIKEYEQNN